MWFVLAVASAPTVVVFENNVTGVYDEGNFSVNWTTGGGDEVNYSIYIYTGGTFFAKADNDSNTGYSFNNWTEANYTFIIEAVNATLNATNSTSNISIYVDRTAPVITLPVYTNATPKKNTTTLTLNISVIDAFSGETGSVCLVDINGTNQSFAVSSEWCNFTVGNLTNLADGNHIISVYVNDTVNILGLNNSFVVQADTTVPTASASCSPSSVTLGDTVTCTCGGSDSTSGINSSLTTAASTITSSQTGTFTYSCSVTDNAGNSGSTTASYTVESSGGGSATSSFWTSTHSISDEIFEKGYTKEMQVKQRVRVQVGSDYHYIGVVSLTETKATIDITSDPVQVILGIGEDAKVDVTDDGFYDIYVILNSIVNNKADITMQKIHEEIPAGEGSITTTGEVTDGEIEGEEEGEDEEEEGRNLTWLWIIMGAVVLAAIIGGGVAAKKRKS